MFFNALLIVLTCVFAATFHVGDSVVSFGLQTDKYDDRLGIIVGDAIKDEEGQFRYPVMFWMGLDEHKENVSLRKCIKPENLVVFDGSNFFPEVAYDPTNLDQARKLAAYSDLLVELKSKYDQGCSLAARQKTLVISAVLKEFGGNGMMIVLSNQIRHFRI